MIWGAYGRRRSGKAGLGNSRPIAREMRWDRIRVENDSASAIINGMLSETYTKRFWSFELLSWKSPTS